MVSHEVGYRTKTKSRCTTSSKCKQSLSTFYHLNARLTDNIIICRSTLMSMLHYLNYLNYQRLPGFYQQYKHFQCKNVEAIIGSVMNHLKKKNSNVCLSSVIIYILKILMLTLHI